MSQNKVYLTYLEAGEFGPVALWGVFTNRTDKPSVQNWIAFYATQEAAISDYPEAVRV